MAIVGRGAERDRLRRALDSARERRAQVLALEGPPGCGKSVLLDDAIDAAREITLMRSVGIEGEHDLPFASLLALVRPHLAVVEDLPDVPRAALLGALALAPPTMADRLAIGAAVLQLIGLLSERRPVLIVVDDLQWVDAASRDALMFAIRRVQDDRVAVLFGVRERAGVDLRGIGVVPVGPLGTADAARLLQSRHDWSDAVAADVAVRCEGNPLALLEVGEMLTDRHRRGLEALPDRLPAGRATIQLFREQIEGLSDDARFALLVAALSHDPGRKQVVAACRSVGADEPDWSELDAARVVLHRGDRLAFTHPLVRSAVIELASPNAVRRAHEGLAEVVDGHEHRTWHRAEAASDADEAVASELEQMALAALLQGDSMAALKAATRAAELSEDDAAGAGRYLLAAQSASLAGVDPTDQIERARTGPAEVRGEALVIEAATSAWAGDTATLQRLLEVDLADLERENRTCAALVCAFAAFSAFNEMQAESATKLSEQAWALADERFDIAHPFGLMPGAAVAINTQFGGGRLSDLLECRRLVEEREAVDVATPVTMGLLVVDRHDDALDLATAMYAAAVRTGRVVAAAWTATACGMTSYLMGDLAGAERWCALGRELGQATGVAYVVAQATSQLAAVAALRGDRPLVAALTSEVDVPPLCDSPVPTLYARRFASILDELRSGSLDAAVQQLRAFPQIPTPLTEHWPVVYELIEALVLLERHDEARMLMPPLDAIGADGWLRHDGQIERCRGLVAEPSRYDEHFRRSIEHLQVRPRRIELARTQLTYGERLCRDGRRQEASGYLRSALVTFDEQGCRPWGDRARAALGVVGSSRVERPGNPLDQLTMQEDQVAHAVASGMTNREAAAALFVSPKTIETHLTRIYRKLGVRSRTELANAVRGRPGDPPPNRRRGSEARAAIEERRGNTGNP